MKEYSYTSTPPLRQCGLLQGETVPYLYLTAPHRHDLLITSCINNEVQIFNRKLHKIMKNKVSVRILDQETNREDFTQHGLHLNATGKDKVVKLMSLNISQLYEVRKNYPIILKWRTTHGDPSLVNNVLNVINKDQVITNNKGGTEDHMDSNNQGIRTPTRTKRFLNTRSNDFLWV